MWTYLLQSGGESGPVKIGRSGDVIQRIRELNCGSATPLRLIALVDGNRERALHKRFAHLRKHGEWFEFSPEILEAMGEAVAVEIPPLPLPPTPPEKRPQPHRWMPRKRPDPPGSIAHSVMGRVIGGTLGRRQ